MGNFDERDQRPPQPVIIEDKRHGRSDSEEEAESQAELPSPAAAAQPEPAQAAPEQPASQQPEYSADELRETSGAEPLDTLLGDETLTDDQLSAAQQAEMAYLMQLFQLGQTGYLRSQLGVLLNFAMINLGRMPNPATGIVTANLEEAKTAIDIFEFVLVKVQKQLDPRELAELTQLLSDMKYTFMQALGGGPAGVPPASPAAG